MVFADSVRILVDFLLLREQSGNLLELALLLGDLVITPLENSLGIREAQRAVTRHVRREPVVGQINLSLGDVPEDDGQCSAQDSGKRVVLVFGDLLLVVAVQCHDYDDVITFHDSPVDYVVADKTSVHIHLSVILHRFEDNGNAHAGPHCGKQVAVSENDLVTCNHVGRVALERNHKILVEVYAVGNVSDAACKEIEYLIVVNEAGNSTYSLSKGYRYDIVRMVVKCIRDLFVTGGVEDSEQVHQVCAGDNLGHLLGADSRTVKTSDQSSHAGSEDLVDRDTVSLEFCKNGNVGDSLCSASGKNNGDMGSSDIRKLCHLALVVRLKSLAHGIKRTGRLADLICFLNTFLQFHNSGHRCLVREYHA